MEEYTIKLTEEELQEEVLAFAHLEDKLRIATGKSW